MNQLLLWLFEARFRLFIKGITEKPRHDNRNRPCRLSPHRFLKVSYFELRENLGCHWGKLGVSVQYIHLQGVKYSFMGFFVVVWIKFHLPARETNR